MTALTEQTEVLELDLQILNILRSEPPSHNFDFYGYAGLPRSILTLLNKVPNLEQLVLANKGKSIDIPSSSNEGMGSHRLMYDNMGTSFLVISDAYNNYSHQSDLKFFSRKKVQDITGKEYNASLIAVEVYREKGKPIWEVGLYISDGQNIIYEESTVFEIDSSETRAPVCAPFMIYMGKSNIIYDPEHKGLIRNPAEFAYLNYAIDQIPGARIVGEDEFRQNAAKWFRYLQGTLDIQKVLKFEDRYNPSGGIKKYRVILRSPHLTDQGEVRGRYAIELLDGSNVVEDGPFPHQDALECFLETGNSFLNLLYEHAGKGKRQFDIALDHNQVDFRWMTIIKDSSGNPITVTSWSTPYNIDGRKLPHPEKHHYLQLWNSHKQPQIMSESVEFEHGIHPRKFMPGLLKTIAATEYKDVPTLIAHSRVRGVPYLINA